MQLYANIQNPLRVDNREQLVQSPLASAMTR